MESSVEPCHPLLVSLLQEKDWDGARRLLEVELSARSEGRRAQTGGADIAGNVDDGDIKAGIIYALERTDVTQLLLSGWREYIIGADGGALLLALFNAAAANPLVPGAVVQLLLDLDSHLAHNACTETGKTPLHLACSCRHSVDVIKLLAAANPAAALIKERRNQSCPLHYLCAFKGSAGAATALLEISKAPLLQPDVNSFLPLHLAIIFQADPALIEVLVHAAPDAVRIPDNKQRLALHLAAQYRVPVSVLRLLVESYPLALYQRDAYEKQAIHTGLKYGLDPASIHYMLSQLDAHHSDASILMTQSSLLHAAIEFSASPTVVLALLERYPESVREPNVDGKLPLHVCCWKQGSKRLAELLIEKYPEALKVPECKYQNLPLHYAVQYSMDPEATLTVLRAYPEAASKPNIAGRMPMFLAARYHAHLSVVDALIIVAPSVLSMRDQAGKVPLDYSLEYGASADVIARILGKTTDDIRDALVPNDSFDWEGKDGEEGVGAIGALITKSSIGDKADAAPSRGKGIQGAILAYQNQLASKEMDIAELKDEMIRQEEIIFKLKSELVDLKKELRKTKNEVILLSRQK
jgi:ankyrin repeat protein